MRVLNSTANYRLPNQDLMPRLTNNSLLSELQSLFQIKQQNESVSTAISVKYLDNLSLQNEEIINNIKSFKYLEEDWDNEGALPIHHNSINKSIEIVSHIELYNLEVYLASPGPNEEILLILKNNFKEIELIVYPDKMKFVKFNQSEFIEQGEFDIDKIHELVSWLS